MLNKIAEETKNTLLTVIKGAGEVGVALQTGVKDKGNSQYLAPN